ncbi:hypothetical protein F5Y14DRAFT_116810 [Nemania sp. NC0429]|nr:hypothetical protein F5Y14DRAFT_116810 [Nemania sp. NC0429]
MGGSGKATEMTYVAFFSLASWGPWGFWVFVSCGESRAGLEVAGLPSPLQPAVILPACLLSFLSSSVFFFHLVFPLMARCRVLTWCCVHGSGMAVGVSWEDLMILIDSGSSDESRQKKMIDIGTVRKILVYTNEHSKKDIITFNLEMVPFVASSL